EAVRAHHAGALDRRDRARPALRHLLLRGVSRRPRKHPARPVGGRDCAQPHALSHLQGRDHPAGDPAGGAGPRQLLRRHVQGDAAPVRDRGGRADADRQDPRLLQLSLPRADDPGRRLLPGHEPDRLGAQSAGRALAQTTQRTGPMSDDLALAPNEPMVRFQGVTKRYGALTVLDRLDLDVAPNEKVAIIGPSGSGKTTVLRMLMTLERIDGGVIWVEGEPLTHEQQNGQLVPAREAHLRRVRGKIGMVFQHFNLFPHMSALKNCMEAPVHVLGMAKDEAEQRASELLDMVGLGDKKHHYPAQLSGGQQQRVAIARALAMRPKVMLFDEVTSALDPELVGEVLNVIRRLGAEHNLTMLMVTHQMGFAREFADRVCFFYAGKIAEQGSPDQLFTNPQN